MWFRSLVGFRSNVDALKFHSSFGNCVSFWLGMEISQFLMRLNNISHCGWVVWQIEKKGFFMFKGWCVSLKCSFSSCEVCLQGSQSQWVYREGTRLVSQSSKTYPTVSCGRCKILFCWIYLLCLFFPEEIIIHVHKIHLQRIVYVFLFFKWSYFMKFHFCVASDTHVVCNTYTTK
jgi:hypothetical protein